MLSLGIDFGTSGVRAITINATGQIVAQSRQQFSGSIATQPDGWARSLWHVIEAIPLSVRKQISRIAINGTSATMMLCNQANEPLTSALMYNDDRARSVLPKLLEIAPAGNSAGSPAVSATSSLVKALWLQDEGYDRLKRTAVAEISTVSHIAHQADWLASLLHGQPGISDYHNALKLGYDVKALAYPDWLLTWPVANWLPEVLEPGEAIAPILPTIADRFSFPKACQICTGTTDSIAAFLASGAQSPGEAVTSLGSTLVLKLLSPQPIDHQAFGIYSHRLGDLWLAGGASNTGGAVLKQFFSAEQLAALSTKIDLSAPSPYEYYPLTTPGERFPINDPDYPAKLTPRPKEDADFLYGLLDAMARIETEGYRKLHALGAESLRQVYTAGGGAKNEVWQTLRQRKLGVPVNAAVQTEAAYGTAQLAMSGLSRFAQH